MLSELEQRLAELVVLATDLRDEGRSLIERADRLYEKVIDVALRVRSEPHQEIRKAIPASVEDEILVNKKLKE